MNNIITEKQYQRHYLDRLVDDNDFYEIPKREDGKDTYDRNYAMCPSEVFKFLEDTQPEKMTQLRKLYQDKTEETILASINRAETQKRGSRLDVLKRGVNISNVHLDLHYPKPATTYGKKSNELYNKNRYSVRDEVWISDEERIDVVVFVNGLAFATFELKSNPAGQDYKDAIKQYKNDRDPDNRIFLHKSGALVYFAMDLYYVAMTTKMNGESTFFIPFNQGRGEGIETGDGNPIDTEGDKISVSYMWEEIFTKDSLNEIISNLMFIEHKKEEKLGREITSENVIFPRYHQLDMYRKTLKDVKINKTSQNYLYQHSTGSGKTNEIAWLSYGLATLHDAENNKIIDTVIVCTDRTVVDRQLQEAINFIDHQSGFIRLMGDNCTSKDLKNAIESNTKIIVTTIQKFPYIVEELEKKKDKKYAVVIDEAHSSTTGKNMLAVTMSLGNDVVEEEYEAIDVIMNEVAKRGKQENVSMYAFTATPKPTTLEMFGRTNADGNKEAFHIYSMKQAIEEGFIIDVLQNYTTYDTFFDLNKTTPDDPIYETGQAKRQIKELIIQNPENIEEKASIIVEHFRNNVQDELGGQAKAMIITSSRKEAVLYKFEIDKYIREHHYGLQTLVAFSGSIDIDGKTYTESSINGFSEKKLPKEFDENGYGLLIVANKYQTGFDQKKLCAMYILKKLDNISAVQTLSRLNRICPPYDKKTFVLDFVNEYEDIEKSFSKFYAGTILANSVSVSSVYDLEARLDAYKVIDAEDIKKFCKQFFKKKINNVKGLNTNLSNILMKNQRVIDEHIDKNEIISTIRSFIRCYEFISQATILTDTEFYQKYTYLSYLIKYLHSDDIGMGFNLKDQVKARNFSVEVKAEHKGTKIEPSPTISLPMAEPPVLAESKKDKLSKIIESFNKRYGKNYEIQNSYAGISGIREMLGKNEEVKSSIKSNNRDDFKLALNKIAEDFIIDALDDAIDNMDKNKDFFMLLLSNEEAKNQILNFIADELYDEKEND